MASTNAAVFPVPLCDCAMKFLGGSAKSRGRARSWIFEGRLNPMAYRPLRSAGRLGERRWRKRRNKKRRKGGGGMVVCTCTEMLWRNILHAIPREVLLAYTHHRTYRGSSSKDLTENNGEFGSCLCTSTSWTFSTSLVRRTLVRREASAACVSLSGRQGGQIVYVARTVV